MRTVRLQTPLKDVSGLRAGDKILLSGVVYTARDDAHKRLMEIVTKGKKFPFDLKNAVLYYTGPTPTRPGEVIGSCGPTTSYRMDPYTIPLLKKGVALTIGKGERSKEIKNALKKYKSVYAIAIGGAGALLAKYIKRNKIIAFKDLETGAIRRLEVENFPAIVAYDVRGGDVFEF